MMFPRAMRWPLGLSWAPLFIVVLLLRSWTFLRDPQFWAEDGAIFYTAAMRSDSNLGRLFFEPYVGYLHGLPRLASALAVAVPMEQAPWVMFGAGLLVQCVPFFWLLSARSHPFLPENRDKIWFCLVYTLAPGTLEIHGTITNAHWYLPLVAMILLCCTPATAWWGRALEYGVLGLIGLSGPFGMFLVLAFGILHGFKLVRVPAGFALVLLGTALVQGWFLLHSQRFEAAAEGIAFTGAQILELLWKKALAVSLFGLETQRLRLASALNVAGLNLLAVVLFVGLAVRAVRKRHAFLIGTGLIAAMIFVSFVLTAPQPHAEAMFVAPENGIRYLAQSIFFLVFSYFFWGACSTAPRGRFQKFALALCALSLCVGSTADFVNRRQRPELAWRRQLDLYYAPAQPGQTVSVPINPPPLSVPLTKE